MADQEDCRTSYIRLFLRQVRGELIQPGRSCELHLEFIPMSVPVQRGERLRLEMTDPRSRITQAPTTHCHGQTFDTETFHYEIAHPSRGRLHERRRASDTEQESTT